MSGENKMTPEEQLERERSLSDLLAAALQNVAYHEARISPPPYGHSCRWCGDCVQRAKDEARAALAQHAASRAGSSKEAE